MTPKEAINTLKNHTQYYVPTSDLEALNMAICALKEIQQYREIGTVKECREAVEKQKPKKPTIGADFMVGMDDKGNPIWVHDYVCPECGMGIAGEYICCPYCGQAIRWENLKGMEDENT